MAKVSISEAARLTGKSRTTLHRLIKAGELSTCRGERNAKMLDTSELLRVFGAFAPVSVEQEEEQVSGQRDTVTSDRNEQVIYILKQEIEHLNTLLASRDSHIDSLKQAMLLLENREESGRTRPGPGGVSGSPEMPQCFCPAVPPVAWSFSSFRLRRSAVAQAFLRLSSAFSASRRASTVLCRSPATYFRAFSRVVSSASSFFCRMDSR
jgi:hypothetical protein